MTRVFLVVGAQLKRLLGSIDDKASVLAFLRMIRIFELVAELVAENSPDGVHIRRSPPRPEGPLPLPPESQRSAGLSPAPAPASAG